MSDRIRCACQCCAINSLMGPAIITTLGILFLLSELRGDSLSFGNTWPVILLVAGAIKLVAALSSKTGHVNGTQPPPAQSGFPQAPPPAAPYQGQGQ